MKKLLIAIMFIIFISINAANAYELNRMSDDSKIISALEILEKNNQTEVLDRLQKNNVKIMFYDLSMLSYQYAKHFAVASTDEYGDKYILINSNLMSSPKAALACLIAHESVHELAKATQEEEVLATTTEAETWMLLKDQVSDKYANDVLVQRLNKIALMNENKSITVAIANNSFYQNQLAK